MSLFLNNNLYLTYEVEKKMIEHITSKLALKHKKKEDEVDIISQTSTTELYYGRNSDGQNNAVAFGTGAIRVM